MSKIPRVDLTPLRDGGCHATAAQPVLAALRAGACDSGFLIVTGHGVPLALIDDLLAAARAFFALPAEAKLGVAPQRWNAESPNVYRGYFPAAADGKEGFDIGEPVGGSVGDPALEALRLAKSSSPFHERNRFPGGLSAVHLTAIDRYFEALSSLGTTLVRAIVAALGGEPRRVGAAFPQPGSASTLRFNAYPFSKTPHVIARDGSPLCCASHVDNGILTILYQDENAGLQVRDPAGRWRDVPYDPATFVVNTGLAFQRLTGGVLAATPHRVLRADAPRLSIPFFFEPRPDLRLDPTLLGLGTRDGGEPPTYESFLEAEMRRFPEYARPSPTAPSERRETER